MWKRKGDIPLAQINDEVILNELNRLKLKFEDYYSIVVF
jgi:hypothetical protein